MRKWFDTKLIERQWLRVLIAAFFVLLIIFLSLPIVLEQLWQDKVYPNVQVGSLVLGGMTLAEVQDLLTNINEKFETEGFEFIVGNERVVVFPVVTAPGDPDLSYELLAMNTEVILEQIFAVHRQDSFLADWLGVYQALLTTTQIPVSYEIDEGALLEVLANNFDYLEDPARNASFIYEEEGLQIESDMPGVVLDYGRAIVNIKSQIESLANEPIEIVLIEDFPEVDLRQAASLEASVLELLERAPFYLSTSYTLGSRDYEWQAEVDRPTMAGWLTPVVEKDGLVLTFGDDLKTYLEKQAQEINQEPLDAKFEIIDGRIDQFQGARDGIGVDVAASMEKLAEDFIQAEINESTLVLSITHPSVPTEEVNDLGIKEIIGIGRSDFSGSPGNRRINIQVSSDKLNGLLISPGEEFSLVEALKPFTAEAGYVPELVIKGNRLIPEIGGGACQIGTTTFRAALDSGLEISARRNHSFAVSYYNDENGLPGTDATIYDPAPDFRFVNNTPGHVLIQTHVGDDGILTYEFWGTPDGRQASTTIPLILSRSPAPDTKYIETEDLAPGVTDCSGSNVPGYDTTFTYSILTAEGEHIEENFDSHYRPWQRVCLIGVEKVIEEGEEAKN